MTTHRRHARSLRLLGAAVVACGIGLLHSGTAAASHPLVSEPVFGSSSEPYPPLDFPELVTQPGQATSTITSVAPVKGSQLQRGLRAPERTGGIGADLLGSQPLDGNVFGGTGADIVPHDDPPSIGTQA